MNSQPNFFLSKRLKSFVYAGKGIATLVRTQPNAWIHTVATLCVVGAIFYFEVTRVEASMLLVCCALVWIAEGLNTSIEFLANYCSPDYAPLIEKTKDVAAGAVLLAAFFSLCVGSVILFPYVLGG